MFVYRYQAATYRDPGQHMQITLTWNMTPGDVKDDDFPGSAMRTLDTIYVMQAKPLTHSGGEDELREADPNQSPGPQVAPSHVDILTGETHLYQIPTVSQKWYSMVEQDAVRLRAACSGMKTTIERQEKTIEAQEKQLDEHEKQLEEQENRLKKQEKQKYMHDLFLQQYGLPNPSTALPPHSQKEEKDSKANAAPAYHDARVVELTADQISQRISATVAKYSRLGRESAAAAAAAPKPRTPFVEKCLSVASPQTHHPIAFSHTVPYVSPNPSAYVAATPNPFVDNPAPPQEEGFCVPAHVEAADPQVDADLEARIRGLVKYVPCAEERRTYEGGMFDLEEEDGEEGPYGDEGEGEGEGDEDGDGDEEFEDEDKMEE